MRGSQSQLGELKRSLLGSQPTKRSGLFENTRPTANRLSSGYSRERRTMVEVLQAQKPSFFNDTRQPRTKSVESLKYLPAQTVKPTSVTRTASKLQAESGLQLNFHRQTSSSSGNRIDMASLRERAASASLDVLRLDLNAVKFNKMLSYSRDHQKDHKLLFGTKTNRSGSLDGSKFHEFGSSQKKTGLGLDRNVPSLSGKLDSMLKSVNKKSTKLLFGSGALDSLVGRPKAATLQFEQSSANKRSKKYDAQPGTVDSILEGWRSKPLSELQKQIPSNTLNTWRTEEKLKQRVLFRDGITAFRSNDTGILLSNKEQRVLMAPTTYALAGDDLAAAYTTGSSVPTVSFKEDLASPGVPVNHNPLQNYFSFKNGKPPQKEDFSKKLMLGNLNLQSLNEAAQRGSNGFSSAHLKFSSTTERAEVRATGTGHCLSSRDRTSAGQNPYELETLRNSSRPTVELLKQSRELFDFKKDQFKAVAPVGHN